MKISIIGYSGAGKSTLARRLGKKYNIDVLHFDAVQFLPDWEIRELEEKQRITKEFLDSHESWIIDGNYSKLFYERRMEESDMIIILLFNRISCLHRVVKRYKKFINKTRPDMGKGCNEKLDGEFIWWVLYKGRKKGAKERYNNVLSQYAEKTIVIRNQKQLDAWMKVNNKIHETFGLSNRII